MIRKIAVTGATGHIGANMVRGLLNGGFEVRALYHNKDNRRALSGLAVEQCQADVLNPDSLVDAFEGVDAVVHLAAIISLEGDPEGKVMKTNRIGPRNVVQACLACGVQKLIHFSSIHAFQYSALDPAVTEAHPPAGPASFLYDQSKAAGEREIMEGVALGLDAVILNPTAVLGPFDYGASYTGQMLRKLMQGALPALPMGGFDWVDARDLVIATIAALQQGRAGERYILSGHWASARQLAELCGHFSGQKPPRLELPLWAVLLGLPFLKAYSKLTGERLAYTYQSIMVLKHSNRNCSHEKAQRELGYRPRPLKNTIRDIYKWYKAEKIL
ncbi:MAG TPA: NAD-dependent epimerase/dehydratase family protein [Saprospiraceae bacterium]|nr:NAD-dependent epimerase/dehydratase family protein [Saprospiraceae bacterium]